MNWLFVLCYGRFYRAMGQRKENIKNEKETRENLLKSAKKEFLEKGFMKASLRTICRNAGVTTGALYFFFQDKEDLFAGLVQEPLTVLLEVMNNHYRGELELSSEILSHPEDFSEDIATAREVVRFMYRYYDEFQLLLLKSQGTRFENFADQFVDISEMHYRRIADRIADSMGNVKMEDYMFHWLAHMHIDAFIYLLTHEKSVENACRHVETIVRYFIAGWLDMFEMEK